MRGAQPSFGQWIMALAEMFSLQSLLSSSEKQKLLPAKTGSFSDASSPRPCLPSWWSYPTHPSHFSVHFSLALPQLLRTWAWSWDLPTYKNKNDRSDGSALFLSIPLSFLLVFIRSSDHAWSDAFDSGVPHQGERQHLEWSWRKLAGCYCLKHVWVNGGLWNITSGWNLCLPSYLGPSFCTWDQGMWRKANQSQSEKCHVCIENLDVMVGCLSMSPWAETHKLPLFSISNFLSLFFTSSLSLTWHGLHKYHISSTSITRVSTLHVSP